MLEGGQVDRRGQRGKVAGVVGVRHDRVPLCGSCAAVGRPRLIAEGTRRACGGPAVPPSLAVRPARLAAGAAPALFVASCGRFYWAAGHHGWAGPCVGRSSGGSGVIWSLGLPPGSHRPRVAPGRGQRQLSPSTPCRLATIADHAREPTGHGRRHMHLARALRLRIHAHPDLSSGDCPFQDHRLNVRAKGGGNGCNHALWRRRSSRAAPAKSAGPRRSSTRSGRNSRPRSRSCATEIDQAESEIAERLGDAVGDAGDDQADAGREDVPARARACPHPQRPGAARPERAGAGQDR